MALKKSLDTKTGVKGDYIRIIEVSYIVEEGLAKVLLWIYKNKKARDGDKRPLAAKWVIINDDELLEQSSFLSDAYSAVKVVDEDLSDAEDC
jgi:hypothetical protein